jgi:lysyl-tRNA synthetase class 2
MYNVVFKNYWILAILLGFVERFSERRSGEISVHIYGLTVLAKAKFCCKTDADGKTYDAFADAEQRYKSSLRGLVNDHEKKLYQENKMFNAMRSFFNDRGYLEVETPVLQPIPGGAAARPFITHHNSLTCPCTCVLPRVVFKKD